MCAPLRGLARISLHVGAVWLEPYFSHIQSNLMKSEVKGRNSSWPMWM